MTHHKYGVDTVHVRLVLSHRVIAHIPHNSYKIKNIIVKIFQKQAFIKIHNLKKKNLKSTIFKLNCFERDYERLMELIANFAKLV